ncbi:MAG: hypothetical protein H8D97_01285 [Proteobacteria bacterium]|nr:hypothetical protein [Pseudomonadota bacterium]
MQTTTGNTDITLVLEKTSKIECIKTRLGDSNILTTNQNKVQLTLNTIYKLPITNRELSLTESNCLSPIGKVNEKIQILNVQDGIVTVLPIVHGLFLENGEILGKLI